MNATVRIKMLKAMEFIARKINNESIFDRWLTAGIADGDIEREDLTAVPNDLDSLEYYTEDQEFADLMSTFLCCMGRASKSGGLYCDGVVSRREN